MMSKIKFDEFIRRIQRIRTKNRVRPRVNVKTDILRGNLLNSFEKTGGQNYQYHKHKTIMNILEEHKINVVIGL